ncbi:hypothetical protein [Hymenobacter sp.]|uniref:hypothetical protein n=1 Tax=Hymenobacter sp. TaxID=1898978 RepID=UPI00286CEEBF|nr:hypothetical protein [Hymenobacter sp.]
MEGVRNSGIQQSAVLSVGQEAGTAPAGRADHAFVNRWQTALLPFMTKTLAALAFLFFVGSFLQLYYLYERINAAPTADLRPALQRLDAFRELNADVTSADILAATRWHTLATLEALTVQRRHHQANMLLLSRVWITYLGFVTGMILTIVGATFVLGKLQEAESRLAAEGAGGKIALQTASPGLVLALLGAALMFTTMVTHYKIEVVDQPSYIHEWPSLPGPAPARAPAPPGELPRDSADDTVIPLRPAPLPPSL